jgi:hypothetical protein
MPAEHRLWLHQQACPAQARDAFAQRRQDHPIARTPVHSLDLPLQNLDLAPQSQGFRLQLGSIAVAGRQRIQQEAQERVDDRAEHPAGNPI